MRALISFFVHKPVVANLLVIVIVGAGLIFGLDLRREFFPEVRPNQVLVAAPYPGAAPDEIEQSLALKIEDAVSELNDVKEILTTVTEGLARIIVEFEPGVEIEAAVSQVKRKIDALQDLPEEAERIIVAELEPNLPVISLSLSGDNVDERALKDAIRRMRDDLRTLPGMGQIVLSGIRDDEISVELRPGALLEHRLSLVDVSRLIGEAMAEIPGGAVRSTTANISVRTVGAAERVDEVRSIIVKTGQDGTAVRVEDIADVRRGFEDVDLVTRINNEFGVSLTAFKVGDQDAIQIAQMVRAYAAGRLGDPLELTARDRLRLLLRLGRGDDAVAARIAAHELGASRRAPPPGNLTLHTDLSRFITGRLDLLTRNAMYGGTLVFLTLLVLVNLRVALWVTVGLTIAILGTLAFMAAVGISMNMLTMFGLIIVLGLLVDDAIVVAENITARTEAGEPALAAAVDGASTVSWPVVATILTSIFAFSSFTLVEGRIGDLLAVLPKVVIVALTVSLVESLLVLPSHMAHSTERARRRADRSSLARFLSRADRARAHVVQRIVVPRYMTVLRVCLDHRYLSLAVAVAILLVSLGMVAGGRVPFTFLGTQDSETVLIDLRMPVGTPLEGTDAVVRRLEAATLAQPEVTTVVAAVGQRGDTEGTERVRQPHIAQLWLELLPAEKRDRSSDDVIIAIRDAVADIAGIKRLRITAIQGGPEGPALNYTVTADNPRRIAPVVEQIKQKLSRIDGVTGIADDAEAGQRELRISLLPGATQLGLTTENLARQIRGAVFGLEAHTFAAPDEDVDVRVMFDRRSRRSLAAIERMHVFTPDGRPVPLSEAAAIEETESYAAVHRLNRRRAVTVTADADERIANPEQISAALAPDFRAMMLENPGVRIEPRGRQQQVNESLSTLPVGLAAASGLIYVALAWLFGSYIQPLAVLVAVPFATVGMVWGHFLMGFELTLLSLIGFIALSGVVVNGALIFIDVFNRKRREGIDVREAALEAGRARFRAIVLTTVTTVLGLSPLMAEQDFQARFLIPMAITISFGLISSTFIVLLVMPCLLLIGADVQRAARMIWTGQYEAAEPPFPPRTGAAHAEGALSPRDAGSLGPDPRNRD